MIDMKTVYKLTILYLLMQADLSLTGAQISECMLDTLMENYFTLQTLLGDLTDAGFITTSSTHRTTQYTITEAGIQTLNGFGRNIPDGFRENVNIWLRSHGYDIRRERDYSADYVMQRPNMYIVRCELKEWNVPLMTLSLNVPGESEAISICDNWREHASEVYTYALQTLMR